MSDSPDITPSPKDAEFCKKLEQILEEFDVRGVMIYQLPEDLQSKAAAFHSFSRGHFYDTSRLVSNYVKEIKTSLMNDLDGIM